MAGTASGDIPGQAKKATRVFERLEGSQKLVKKRLFRQIRRMVLPLERVR